MFTVSPTPAKRHAVAWLKLLVIAAIVVVLGLLALPATRVEVWVGSRDVDFVIRVVDELTGEPILGARVLQFGDGDDRDERTNADGMIAYRKQCTTTGKFGAFVNTMSVHIPDQTIFVSAEGYANLEYAQMADYRRLLRHIGPTSELAITLALRKKLKPTP